MVCVHHAYTTGHKAWRGRLGHPSCQLLRTHTPHRNSTTALPAQGPMCGIHTGGLRVLQVWLTGRSCNEAAVDCKSDTLAGGALHQEG
jgi:hypothetical protein